MASVFNHIYQCGLNVAGIGKSTGVLYVPNDYVLRGHREGAHSTIRDAGAADVSTRDATEPP